MTLVSIVPLCHQQTQLWTFLFSLCHVNVLGSSVFEPLSASACFSMFAYLQLLFAYSQVCYLSQYLFQQSWYDAVWHTRWLYMISFYACSQTCSVGSWALKEPTNRKANFRFHVHISLKSCRALLKYLCEICPDNEYDVFPPSPPERPQYTEVTVRKHRRWGLLYLFVMSS